MRKSGLPVPVAALMSGVLIAGAAAQEIGGEPTKLAPRAVATQASVRDGNPLWAIPIGDLSETQARPLFSPSRRPPSPPVVAAPARPANSGAPSKREPDHPLLTLLGTIVSHSVEIGVFVDEASHDVIRLKAGDAHEGWTLSSVVRRAAFFQKEGYRAATLALPAPGAEATASSGHAAVTTGGNARIRFAPPVSNFVPVNTEGGSRRPPREG
jgi:general secretion pathway protein N